MIVVLDLGLGQGSTTLRAPMDRLQAPFHVPGEHETVKSGGDLGLICVVHGQIRVIPAPEHSETYELVALHLVEAVGVLPARVADFRNAHLELLRAELLVDVVLDRQPVPVPTRDIRAVVAQHRARLDHDVLENLVEGGADVDRAVCIGRTVVQDEAGRSFSGLANTAVQVHLPPTSQALRLSLRELCTHGEARPRKVQRFSIHLTPPPACEPTRRRHGRQGSGLNRGPCGPCG